LGENFSKVEEILKKRKVEKFNAALDELEKAFKTAQENISALNKTRKPENFPSESAEKNIKNTDIRWARILKHLDEIKEGFKGINPTSESKDENKYEVLSREISELEKDYLEYSKTLEMCHSDINTQHDTVMEHQIEFKKLFDSYDILITPTSPTVAYEIGTKSKNPLQKNLENTMVLHNMKKLT